MCVCVYKHMHAPATCVEVRGQLEGISPLLLPCRFWGVLGLAADTFIHWASVSFMFVFSWFWFGSFETEFYVS